MADRFTLQSGGGVLDLQSGTGDLLLQSSGASALEDDSGGAFLSRLSTVAASLVVAGGLFTACLAHAAATPHNDEPPLGGPSIGDSSYWVYGRARESTIFLYTGEDEVFPAPPTVALEEGEWRPPQPIVEPPVTRLWLENDEITSVPVSFGLDEPDTGILILSEVVRTFVVLGDEFPTAATAVLGLEDTPWPELRAYDQAPTLRVWFGEDERPTPAAPLQIEDDNYQVSVVVESSVILPWWTSTEVGGTLTVEDYRLELRSYELPPVLKVWWGEDERPTPPAPLNVEDTPWPPLRSYDQAPTLRVWIGEDEVVTQPTPLQIEDDSPPVQVVVDSPPIILPWWTSTEVGGVVIVEDYRLELRSQAPLPVLKVWSENDEIVTQPSIIEDAPQPTLLVSQESPVLRVWVGEDERPTPPPPLNLEDSEWTPLRSYDVAPVIRLLWNIDEEFPELSAPPVVIPPVLDYHGSGKQLRQERGELTRDLVEGYDELVRLRRKAADERRARAKSQDTVEIPRDVAVPKALDEARVPGSLQERLLATEARLQKLALELEQVRGQADDTLLLAAALTLAIEEDD